MVSPAPQVTRRANPYRAAGWRRALRRPGWQPRFRPRTPFTSKPLLVIPALSRDPASVLLTTCQTANTVTKGSWIPDQVRDDEKEKNRRDADMQLLAEEFRVVDTDTHIIEPYDLWTSRMSVR